MKITDKIEKVHPNIDQGYVFFAVSGTLLPDKSAVFVVLRSVTMLSLLVTLRAFMMKKTYFRL